MYSTFGHDEKCSRKSKISTIEVEDKTIRDVYDVEKLHKTIGD